VAEIVADALARSPDEVRLQSRLIADLGAESIDFLDIVFRLEKSFDIKIPRGELFPENIAQADSGLIADGKVTPAGIEQLKAKMPHADVAGFAADPRVEKIQDLFTVDMVCKFLAAKIAA
jgi:acyl carrier protein